jgi:hypothetical protein
MIGCRPLKGGNGMNTMNRVLKGTIGGLAIWLAFGLTASAQGNISNQATQITFQSTMELPGKVLPAGTYWFTVLDDGPGGDPNKVQVKTAEGKVIATFNTQTADQAEFGQESTAQGVKWPSGKIVIRVAQGTANQPMALLDWYYPGNTAGHKFIYPTQKQKQLDEYKHQTMSYNPGDKITVGSSQAAFQ